MSINRSDILAFLIESGKIDLDDVERDMKQQQKEELLREHLYTIYQTTDGRWRTYVRDDTKKSGRRPITARTREAVEDKLVKLYSIRSEPRCLEEILDEWQADKLRTQKQATVSRDRRTWNRYFAGAPITTRPLNEITGREIKIWLEELIANEQLTKHQYVQVKTVINQMLDYAVEVGYIDMSPLVGVKISTSRLRQERKRPSSSQVYSDSELQAIRDHAWKDFESRRNAVHQLAPLALLFMFVTGLRIGEACAVRWGDIDEHKLWVRRFLSVETGEVEERTKGSYGDRHVPLVNSAQQILDTAKRHQTEAGVYRQDGYVFSMRTAEPLPYSTLGRLFYRYCSDLGIEPKSSHKARKTYGSRLQRGGVSLESTRQALGHVQETTTLHSYTYEIDDDEAVLARMEEALE